MKYEITADKSKWPKRIGANIAVLPYNECAECFGGIKINFLYGGIGRVYENKTVNIPLFLTELDDFLHRVDSRDAQHWYLGFAPFAHGLLRNESLLISAATGKAFLDGVYDSTSKDDLERLKARVTKDIEKFGKVQMGNNQAGRIVSDF